jgi:hypothetical protein
LKLGTGTYGLHGLVESFPAVKSKALVESHGSLVASRYFQIGFPQTGPPETLKRLKDQRASKSTAAMLCCHTNILDCTHATAVSASLHTSTVALGRSDQPGRFRQKSTLVAYFRHELPASLAIRKARKDHRIDGTEKGLVEQLGMLF